MFGAEVRSKAQILSKDDVNKLKDNISSEQLEKKYGGTVDDLVDFWYSSF